jgi:hypothetical protein
VEHAPDVAAQFRLVTFQLESAIIVRVPMHHLQGWVLPAWTLRATLRQYEQRPRPEVGQRCCKPQSALVADHLDL